MKKIILFSIFSFFAMNSFGQGITTARYANVAAINAIPSPPIGMMVYNNTTQSYWYFSTLGWTNIAATTPGNQWTSLATDAYYNNTGNVGIGTATPTGARLHINGNENTGTTASLKITDTGGGQMLLDGNEIDALGAGFSLRLNENTANNIRLAYGGGQVFIGANGTGIAGITRVTVNIPTISIAANSCYGYFQYVTYAPIGATVFASPVNAMSTGLVISHARVNAPGNDLLIRICNVTTSAVSHTAESYAVTIIY